MNILLIYPQFPDTFWSFKHAIKFVNKRAVLPPLGLLTVASMLPSDWEVRLIDLNVRRLSNDDLAWAEYAFVSAMGIQRQSAVHVISTCKAAGLKVVAGGPLFVEDTEQFQGVDHFVLNEAELTLGPFLSDIAEGSAKRVYSTERFCDMTASPIPKWGLARQRDYASFSIQFSRGCPFECEFCNITSLLGRRHRTKNTSQIISELDCMYELGWRGPVFFVDDNFIGSKHYLKSDLLPELIRWRKGKNGMPFNTEVSINLADNPDLMEAMVEAGFVSVFIGIETPSEKSLLECSKRQNRNRNLLESVRLIQRKGLQVQAGFIVGFDSDTPSIFQVQRDFIQKSGIVTAMVGILQAPKGTKLYERLRQAGRIIGTMTGDNLDGTTNIIPKMDMQTLLAGYGRLLGDIYKPRNYYRRVKTFLREYKLPKVEEPLTFQRFFALFRSFFRLGIAGRERFHYWGLIFWSLLKKPRAFPLAVTFAIYGHHFRKVFENLFFQRGVRQQ